jgi:hypothetical protein
VRGLSSVGVSALRVGVAAAIAGFLVFLGHPIGVIDLAVWVLCGVALYVVLLFVFREARALDFQIARSVLPTKLHGVISRIERAYSREAQP